MVRINRERGTTILLVEQNAAMALAIADYGYVLEVGRIVMESSHCSPRNDGVERRANSEASSVMALIDGSCGLQEVWLRRTRWLGCVRWFSG